MRFQSATSALLFLAHQRGEKTVSGCKQQNLQQEFKNSFLPDVPTPPAMSLSLTYWLLSGLMRPCLTIFCFLMRPHLGAAFRYAQQVFLFSLKNLSMLKR
jgi:hypothetical protein